MGIIINFGEPVDEMEDHESDKKEKRSIECFATKDGKAFLAREETNTTKTLPVGVYKYSNTQAGMFFIKQDVPACKVIGDKTQQSVLSEVDKFWKAAQYYKSLGFPHKRGLLLFGPPGTGKTTLVRLIVQDVMTRGGIALELGGHPREFQLALDIYRASCPETPVVVTIEDIDRYMDGYEEFLLNILDGSYAIEHVLFIAATNKRDELSERLVRPSRFDCLREVGLPDDDSRRGYIKGLLPKSTDAAVEALVKATRGKSMAHLKEEVLQQLVFKTPKVK